jgi:hypothetical protein
MVWAIMAKGRDIEQLLDTVSHGVTDCLQFLRPMV